MQLHMIVKNFIVPADTSPKRATICDLISASVQASLYVTTYIYIVKIIRQFQLDPHIT